MYSLLVVVRSEYPICNVNGVESDPKGGFRFSIPNGLHVCVYAHNPKDCYLLNYTRVFNLLNTNGDIFVVSPDIFGASNDIFVGGGDIFVDKFVEQEYNNI